MKYDVFFSICQTPVDGQTPTEKEMFENFFDQVQLADELGFGTAWVAETHLSCQVQKLNPDAVIPEFQGEIGLNTDILQLAHKIFSKTKNINVGSAIMNILCNGGPLAHAEAIKTFLTLHSLEPGEKRKLNVGFAAGRFPFSNIPYGIGPKNKAEKEAWPVVKGKIFIEALEIFLKVLRGDVISRDDCRPKVLRGDDFRTMEDWSRVVTVYKDEFDISEEVEEIILEPTWQFDKVGVIPFDSPLELLNLTIGTHDPEAQEFANSILPCGVFNLSITPGAKIEETHSRMEKAYHKDGGPWKRHYMPRTVLMFLNSDKNISEEIQNSRAEQQARKAVENYWIAMAGTIDQEKVQQAVDNAIYGSPQEVAKKIKEKYHPEDRLMIWFDFNNHNNDEVKSNMNIFIKEVVPLLEA